MMGLFPKRSIKTDPDIPVFIITVLLFYQSGRLFSVMSSVESEFVYLYMWIIYKHTILVVELISYNEN